MTLPRGLRTTPDNLDALYLATQIGPNVAHIKHFWRTAAKVQAGLLHSRRQQAKECKLLEQGTYEEVFALERKHDPVDIFKMSNFKALKDIGWWDEGDTWLEDEDGPESKCPEEQANLLVGKARVAKALGKKKEAVAAYESAIELAPVPCDIRNELAWYYVHELDENSDNREREIGSAKKLSEQAVNNLSDCYFAALDTFALAKIKYAREVEKDPKVKRTLLQSAIEDLQKLPIETLSSDSEERTQNKKLTQAHLEEAENLLKEFGDE